MLKRILTALPYLVLCNDDFEFFPRVVEKFGCEWKCDIVGDITSYLCKVLVRIRWIFN